MLGTVGVAVAVLVRGVSERVALRQGTAQRSTPMLGRAQRQDGAEIEVDKAAARRLGFEQVARGRSASVTLADTELSSQAHR